MYQIEKSNFNWEKVLLCKTFRKSVKINKLQYGNDYTIQKKRDCVSAI